MPGRPVSTRFPPVDFYRNNDDESPDHTTNVQPVLRSRTAGRDGLFADARFGGAGRCARSGTQKKVHPVVDVGRTEPDGNLRSQRGGGEWRTHQSDRNQCAGCSDQRASAAGGGSGRQTGDRAIDVLENSEANLGYTKIRAPVDGIIIDRKIDPGQTLAAQFEAPELFVISPDMKEKMHIFASIDEADMGMIRRAKDEG